jgi:eukaryotic-like serine/threonine-protein kinase
MSEDDVLRQATERVGTILGGKYHIDNVLGIGGMAVVYGATHRNRKRFAVKVLHSELSARGDIRARFLREGYVANSVNHPAVVAVLDDDVDADGAAFLVMELLDGATVDSLRTRLGGRLPVRQGLVIAHQLLDVLAVAHDSAIVHRDIKPANLFVRTDGQLKVLDFGIARLRDLTTGVQSTQAGAIVGTPSFMAPEQAQALGNEIDPRTDIWAAGASLFMMLSGQFVHEGDNARQLMIRAATVPARSLAEVAPEMPLAVVELVAKALEFEKGARWESAAAMREAVARIHEKLFGAISHEQLMVCLAQAPGERESARTHSPPTAPRSAPANRDAEADAVPDGTRSESPDARRRAAESDVATTTSKPVAKKRRTEGGPRQRRVVVWALVAVVGGLAAAGLVIETVRDWSHGRPVSAVPSEKSPVPESMAASTPQTPAATASEVLPASPSAPAPVPSGSAASGMTTGAVHPRTPTPPASQSDLRASGRAPVAAPTPAKASALPSATGAGPRERDPLQIELQ